MRRAVRPPFRHGVRSWAPALALGLAAACGGGRPVTPTGGRGGSAASDAESPTDLVVPTDGMTMDAAASDPVTQADLGGATDALAMNDAGGADDAGPPPVPTNTRLQAHQLEADGAAPLVLGIWDTKEQVHCSFMADEKGQLRCLPDLGTGLIPTSYFADETCTAALAWIQPSSPKIDLERPWTWQVAQNGCEPARHQVLRPLPNGSPLYGLKDGACKPLTAVEKAPPSDADVPLSADPPERWEIGAETASLRVSDRLRMVETVTPDEARFVKTLADDHWNMPCSILPGAENGSLECVSPTVSTNGSLFGDATCKATPIFQVPTCSPVAFIEDQQKRYALGPPFLGPFYYSAKGCDLRGTATAAADAPHYFTKGDLLGSDAVAPLVATTTGTGRFRLRGLKSDAGGFINLPGGLFWYGGKYLDTVANEDCSPLWDVDGRVRCVPSSTLVDTVTYFGDKACSRYITYCADGAACETKKIIRIVRDEHLEQRALLVFAGATRLDATDIFYVDGGACRQIGAAAKDMVEPKDVISFDVFPLLHERYPYSAGR
jgi:hypothetical protein